MGRIANISNGYALASENLHRHRAENGHQHLPDDRDDDRSELESLLRELVQRARLLSVSDSDQSVLVDVETDDVRVLLVDYRRGRAHANLTPREREIVYLVAEGLSNKRIAARLGISIDTVSTHLRRIFAKLGVTSRSAMVAYLFEVELQLARGAA